MIKIYTLLFFLYLFNFYLILIDFSFILFEVLVKCNNLFNGNAIISNPNLLKIFLLKYFLIILKFL